MSFIELFLLAVGLSMDAFAVSVCKGLAMKKADLKSMAVCGIWFGGFQALMPLAGFLLGSLFADIIEAADHWIAFAPVSYTHLGDISSPSCGKRSLSPTPRRLCSVPGPHNSLFCLPFLFILRTIQDLSLIHILYHQVKRYVSSE